MKAKAQRGFTLIELVVVITILGILAAFAVPRFISLETQAQQASANGLAGSVRAAGALAHALYLASGQPATVDMEGNTITLVNGYPNLATIDDALADHSGYQYDATTGVFTMDANNDCTVTYAQAAANGAPTVTVGSDC